MSTRLQSRNRRQEISAFLMLVCLCGWVGMTLLHDVSHAIHPDAHHAPCAVCQLFPNSAPAAINAELAVRAAAVFECVREIQTPGVPVFPQVFLASPIPRGPPAPTLA